MTAPSPLATPMPWDLVASAYEAEVLPTFRYFAEEALRLAAPPPAARVVDIASGPGTLALAAASRGFTVDALDISPEMVGRVQRRARELALSGVTARIGDGQVLPFEDAAYAAGFSLFGLMFFPDRARGFAELRRVLRPGGRAVVSSWQPMERSPALSALFRALQEAQPTAPGGGAPPPPPLTTPEACRAEMQPFFGDVEVHPASAAVDFPSVDAFWASVQRTMAPIALMRRGAGEEAWAPVARRVGEIVGRTLGSGPVTLHLNAWLTVGLARE
jgi:SAM-dependent methyltransferase